MNEQDKKLCEELRDYPKGKPFSYRWEELQIEAAQAIERLSGEVAELKSIALSDDGAGGDGMRLVLERNQLRAELAALKKAQGEPVAWIVPGADCDCGGFIPCMAYKEGEFTQPLYLHPAEDAKDAARYRWLRAYPVAVRTWGYSVKCSKELDAAIDKAIGEGK